MNENLQPFSDEHLEARITAYILGEASPFEAAEIETLIANSPELSLFANRLRTLNALLKEAETTSNSPDAEWKLSGKRRIALAPVLGPTHIPFPHKENRIRRAAYRAVFGIAAIFLFTIFIKRFVFLPSHIVKESPMIVTYSAMLPETESTLEATNKKLQLRTEEISDSLALGKSEIAFSRNASAQPAAESAPQIHIGGQVSETGPIKFKEGMTLRDAVADAGGANEFGSVKRIQVYRDGKATAYDLTNEEMAQLELQPNDTIQIPQKNWYGCGGGRNEVLAASDDITNRKTSAPGNSAAKAIASNTAAPASIPVPDIDVASPTADLGKGSDFGSGWSESDSAPKDSEIAGLNTEGLRSDESANNIDSIPTTRERTIGQKRITDPFAAPDLELQEELSDLDSPKPESMSGLAQREIGLASVAEARNMRKVGKHDEARAILEKAAAAGGGEEIKAELTYLDDPIRSNPALTSEHTDNVDQVRRNLYMARGNFDLGKFDEAKKSYEDTLRIDPFNSAARRGMERIAAANSDYYRAAHDHTRSELLMQVDKAWELSAPAGTVDERSGYTFFYSDQNQRADATSLKFNMNLEGGAERQKAAEPLSMADLFSKGKDLSPQGNPSQQILQGANLENPIGFTNFESKDTGIEQQPLLGDIPLVGRLLVEKKAQPIDLADLSQEISAAQDPFSTFSLNITDASFQVASSAVAKGERPDPESIKPEQFYNAVSYDDPAPTTGEPVASAIDQLAHPVIPGRNLVRMSVRTASTGRATTQPLVLTLLVDQSGSMARADRRAAMDKALTQLATLMQPDDRITVIGFSRTANLLADSLPGNEAAKLPDIINQASSEGGTNLEQAINLAENLALRHKAAGAQNRIVLFTDGAANLGNADPERLAERVKALRQQDLSFDIAGIGTDDINDQLLSELARHGNGRYYLVGENTGDSLAKQLAGAFRPAAENVKIQVKFNPQRVGNYKLVGFEKDRLKTEDFRNDSVDAAELAADESGTALYQVEPLPDGTGEIGELFVRFRDTATGEMVERSWTIPYESQAPAIDKAQPPMQLAALSMLAAQKLQTGPLADAINFRDLAPTIAAVKQAYSRSPEAQQMITLINALK